MPKNSKKFPANIKDFKYWSDNPEKAPAGFFEATTYVLKPHPKSAIKGLISFSSHDFKDKLVILKAENIQLTGITGTNIQQEVPFFKRKSSKIKTSDCSIALIKTNARQITLENDTHLKEIQATNAKTVVLKNLPVAENFSSNSSLAVYDKKSCPNLKDTDAQSEARQAWLTAELKEYNRYAGHYKYMGKPEPVLEI